MSFNKMPLSISEKEKKAEKFLNFLDTTNLERTNEKIPERSIKKEEMKSFLFRIPLTLFEDLKEISALTGISINSICLDLLRPGIRRKIKDLKEV